MYSGLIALKGQVTMLTETVVGNDELTGDSRFEKWHGVLNGTLACLAAKALSARDAYGRRSSTTPLRGGREA